MQSTENSPRNSGSGVNITSVATSVGILRKILDKRAKNGQESSDNLGAAVGGGRRISLNLSAGVSGNLEPSGSEGNKRRVLVGRKI